VVMGRHITHDGPLMSGWSTSIVDTLATGCSGDATTIAPAASPPVAAEAVVVLAEQKRPRAIPVHLARPRAPGRDDPGYFLGNYFVASILGHGSNTFAWSACLSAERAPCCWVQDLALEH
jgi:hypothetical protein